MPRMRAALAAFGLAACACCWGADATPTDVDQNATLPGKRSLHFGPAPFRAAGVRHAYERITQKPYIISTNNLGQDIARLVGKTELPWAVALMRVDGKSVTLYCGGAHIGGGWILTAAHCITDSSKSQILGQKDLVVAARTVSLSGITLDKTLPLTQKPIYADTYDSFLWKDDVALVRVADKSLPVAPLPTPALERTLTAAGSVLDIAGWGASTPLGPALSVLREAPVNVSDLQRCAQQYPERLVTTAQVCAGTTHQNFCGGDSGGPLFAEPLLEPAQYLGVMSFNDDQCSQDVSLPGVYTLVSQEMPFITEYTGFTLESMAQAAAQQH
jgi:secreted trypsin-like serine protease